MVFWLAIAALLLVMATCLIWFINFAFKELASKDRKEEIADLKNLRTRVERMLSETTAR
jgi:hypothetical protein